MPVQEGPAAGRPVVVVTGASAGIGRAVALAFGERGWRVGLIARGLDRLEATALAVQAAGGEAIILPADVADAPAIERAAERVMATWGSIDVWVNNAMVTILAPVQEMTPEEIRRVTEVTYLGQVHGTLAALRHMRSQDRGTIVQIGSALSYRSIPLQAAYCAAKFAVRGFTDALRSELHHAGSRVRLTMVQLPAVNTPQFDWARSRMRRAMQPVPPIHATRPVAESIVHAALEAPRELWVGGPTLQAIIGQTVMPGVLDRMMARRAWDGQMTSEPTAPRDGNLFDAPPGDPGAEGRFASRARNGVVAVSESAVRGALGLAALGIVAGAAALGWRLGARSPVPDKRLPAREQAARLVA